jgi:hypothetical protein
MKRSNKTIFALIIIITAIFDVEGEVRRDSFLISPRISFADYSNVSNWNGFSINKIPPIAFQVEKYYNDIFSYGGFMGFYRNKYTNDTLSSNFHRDFNIGFGVLGTIHYSNWIEDITDNRIRFGDFDLYLSAVINWVVTNNTIKDNFGFINSDRVNYTETTVDFTLGPVAGVRYYISDTFAMNFEFGTGNLGMVTMGVSWNIARDREVKPRKQRELLIP